MGKESSVYYSVCQALCCVSSFRLIRRKRVSKDPMFTIEQNHVLNYLMAPKFHVSPTAPCHLKQEFNEFNNFYYLKVAKKTHKKQKNNFVKVFEEENILTWSKYLLLWDKDSPGATEVFRSREGNLVKSILEGMTEDMGWMPEFCPLSAMWS